MEARGGSWHAQHDFDVFVKCWTLQMRLRCQSEWPATVVRGRPATVVRAAHGHWVGPRPAPHRPRAWLRVATPLAAVGHGAAPAAPRTMRGRGHARAHGGGYTRDLDGYTSGLVLPGPTGAGGRVPPLEVAAHRGQNGAAERARKQAIPQQTSATGQAIPCSAGRADRPCVHGALACTQLWRPGRAPQAKRERAVAAGRPPFRKAPQTGPICPD